MEVRFLDLKRSHQFFHEELKDAAKAVIESAYYVLGPQVSAFEKEYAAYNQTKFCLGVGNGLDALSISLKALGVGAGDEVIIPANTFIATALAVTQVGARPVFAEPDAKTYNVTAATIEPHINRKTRAIMPVHLYGQSCQMQEIMSLAQKHGLFVIEDNAQAQGAQSQGAVTGSLGHLSGTSFYPGKNLGAFGDAGAITTNDSKYYQKAMSLRNYGSHEKYQHDEQGTNSRLDEIQAAMLRVKLKHLNELTKERQLVAARYNELLAGLSDVQTPAVAKDVTHVYHLYVIQTPKRDSLRDFLKSKGIETLIHYPKPIHLQKAYQDLGLQKGAFPLTEKMAESILSLPIYPYLKDEEIEFVCSKVREFFK